MSAATATDPRPARVIALVVALPMIFGTFQYIIDVYPLYALSKVLPILLSPLALVALVRYRLPERGWFVALGLYAALVTTLASGIDFGGSFTDALATQTKLLPASYYFSFFFILVHLRPSYKELLWAFMILGLGSLASLVLMWVLVPDHMYYIVQTKLFIYDKERGYRITLPNFFINIFIFYQVRLFVARRRLYHLLLAMAGLAAMLYFIKERTEITGVFVVASMALLSGRSLSQKIVFIVVVAIVGVVGVSAIGYFVGLAHSSGSVTVREGTIRIILNQLGQRPIGWLIGFGTLSPLATRTLSEIYQHSFFLADVGWLGIVFEYGILGASLIAIILWRMVVYFRRHLAFARDPLLDALYDEIWYQIVTSVVLYMIFTPSEWAAMLSLFVYFTRRIEEWGGALPRTGASGPRAPRAA
jgi:hypothetical protein